MTGTGTAEKGSRRSRWSTFIHVHAGGQAVVGTVERQGGGDRPNSEDQSRAKAISNAPQPTLWSTDQERDKLPVAGDAERTLSDAWRDVPGRSKKVTSTPSSMATTLLTQLPDAAKLPT